MLPKRSTPLSLLCTENTNKELNYLLNHEFNSLREKQELREAYTKAKEQE